MEEIVIGFDFECPGGIPAINGFTQLGAVACELISGKEVGRLNYYARMTWHSWEDRCVKEFWEKNPEAYERNLRECTASPYSHSQIVNIFMLWVKSFAKNDRKVSLISDNMLYDGALIRYYSDSDVLYVLGHYSGWYDVTSFYYGMGALHKGLLAGEDLRKESSKQLALEALGETNFPESNNQHTHDAEDDARAMVEKWIFVNKKLRELIKK